MNVLQICHKPPFPPVDGGCLAMDDISNGLIRKGFNVKILTLSTEKHPFKKEKLSDNYLKTTKIEAVSISTELRPISAFFNLFSDQSYNVSRFYSTKFEQKIIDVLKYTSFDVIQLESLFVVPYLSVIRAHSKAKVIYRAHNVEQQIWFEKFKQEQNPFKKAYLKLLYQRLKKFEDKHFSLFDGIAAISNRDIKLINELGNTKPIVEIPFSINPTRYYPISKQESTDLFFIGSLDWQPNIKGLDWFLRTCWPSIKKKFPTIILHIAGKAMPTRLLHLEDKQIEVHGEVEDAMEFIRNQGIMVVPLFSGSGIRIKVLEGLALGKAIIGTAKAAEGILVSDQEFIIANTSDEFISSIEKLYLNSTLRVNLGANARKFVKLHFNNDSITEKLIDFYRHL